MAVRIVFPSASLSGFTIVNQELSFSDGSGVTGTADIFTGNDGGGVPNSSHPFNFMKLGNQIIFEVTDNTHGRELWITDGTALGTQFLVDINTVAPTDTHDSTDRTSSWQASAESILKYQAPAIFNGFAYFQANDGTTGIELWRTDGTAIGKTLVANINSGANSSTPSLLTPSGSFLYFVATEAASGSELWRTDGTTTQMVADLVSGNGNSNAENLTDFNGTLFFTASDVAFGPRHLYKVTGAGSPTLISGADFASQLTPLGNLLFFNRDDGTHGAELWVYDGTTAQMVKNIAVTPTGPNPLPDFGSNPQNLATFNGFVYFWALDDTHGWEVWRSDGTLNNTILFADINTNPLPNNSSGPGSPFVVSGNKLYFLANNGTDGQELWVTDGVDGTAAHTHIVKDIVGGANISSFAGNTFPHMTDVDGTLYFTINDNTANGLLSLYKTDGTAANTVVVADHVYYPGTGINPFAFVNTNTPPVQHFNTGATLNEGASTTILNAQLDFDDAQESDSQITYTVTTLPTGGTLFRNGVALGLGGTFTQDDIVNNLLSYTHNGGEAAADSFGFSVSDGVAPALTGKTFAFTISPVNDAPVNAVPGAQAVNEDTNLAIAGIAISDADAAAGSVTTKLSVLHGTLTVAPAGGAAVAGSGTGAVTLTGTVAQINTTLSAAGNIVYKGLQDYNGGDTLTVLTDDGGNSGSGGAKTDSDNVAITVNAVADPPTITSDGGGAAANLDRPENATAVTTVTATDPDSAPITFSIVGGSDAAKFEIDSSTGVLKFINAPNFEAPSDSDANNSYVVQVSASDGALTDEQTITVNVTDVVPELAKKSDFNADGKADILFQATDGTPKVWLVDGVNVSLMGPPLLNPNNGLVRGDGIPHPWRAIDSGDFNGDGRSDIVWQHADGTPAVWLMNGVNILSTGPALLNPGPSWHVIASGDFNGDLMSDILWQNQDGTPAVWLMNGTGVLSTGPALLNPGPSWHAKDAADFNGDGKADILWQNDNGTPAVWLMNGTNVLSTGPALLNPGPTWHVEKAGDFNGDGKADILWQNANGTPAVWLMDGTNVLATGPALTNPGPTWHVKEAADANGDGKADIFWQNDDGTPGIWLMNGTSVLQTGGALANQGPAWHIV